MKQNYFKPNPCYEHNSSRFDQFQPPQYSDIHQPSKEISIDELKVMMQYYFERMNQSHEQEELLAEQELREQEQAAQEKEEPPQNSDIRQLIEEVCGIKVCEEQKQNMEDTMLELLEVCRQKELYCMHNDVDDLIESALNSKLLSINLKSQCLDKEKQEVKNIVEHLTKQGTRITESLLNFRVIHKNSSTSLNNTSQISPVNAIATVLPTEEPKYSLSMGYEHLSTIPKTESDEVIKSSVKNLVQIPSEYEVTSDDESECDVPVKDKSSPVFTTFLNPLFDCNDDFNSNDDESISSDEDVLMENFKVHSNPLFDDDEIKHDKIDPHYFNTESDFVESLSNHDTLFDSSPMFDYLEEFSGELMPSTINSFPRPLENFHANTINETLPSSPILVEDSDSQREEIDIFTGTDDLMPPCIDSDDYDSKGDIHFLEELLRNDFISLPENKSLNFYHHDDPLFPRPPPEPSDVEFFFDFEPDSGELISVMKNNIDELIEDECFDLGGEINVLQMLKTMITFPSYLSFEFFYHISFTLRFLLYFSPLGVKTPFLTLASPFRAGGISSGWNFHVL
nr:hypothetical protein [Tanacetum cinerariifolium]